MKRLETSPISDTVAMPIKSGTLEFLQDSWKEGLAAIIKSTITAEAVDTIYTLSGCINSGSGSNYIISPGFLYLNGEIFPFDGATFTLTGLQKAYARIETTQFTTEADPVQFTDGIPRNVHNIRKIVVENTTVSSSLPEYKDFVPAGKYFKGEVRTVVMDSTEYNAKFVTTGPTAGLGQKEYTGWAVMNGNNGTVNDAGRVEVAFGTGYTTLGATGGEKDHVLTIPELPDNGQPVINGSTIGVDGGVTFNFGYGIAGSGNAHNNMQPYVVRLRIQKL